MRTRCSLRRSIAWLACLVGALSSSFGEVFTLPTANRALFEEDGGARFFTGVVGRNWVSGTYGCVRSEGWRFHEGIDISCTERDRAGEPIDPVNAIADGEIVHCSRKAGLSNYGRYVVVKHVVERMEIYSLYAHLREIREDLHPGVVVEQREQIGVLGRSTNTREGISKARAHLHLEIGFMLNEHFESYMKKTMRGSRNDHGLWNGLNLMGLDAREVFLSEHEQGDAFSLLEHVRSQPEMARVLVSKTDFSWLRRHPYLIRRNPAAEAEGFAAMELALAFNGMPYLVIPRAASELENEIGKPALLSVQRDVRDANKCCKIVATAGEEWRLTKTGERWLDKLLFTP
jgi:murein DD-endopeptidase MepM/ murein hydrolase activator NlpD